jgi:hypothetical protein
MLCNQQQALPIINFDFFGNTTTCDSKHGKLLPNSFREQYFAALAVVEKQMHY